RDPDFCNPETRQRHMETTGHAVRRGHHGICPDDRGDVSAHPPWSTVARLLPDSLPQRTWNLAELPIPPGLGLFRNQHLFTLQSPFPGAPHDPGLRLDPRSCHGLETKVLRLAEPWMAGNAKTVASARIRDAYHGACNIADSRVCAHDRLFRLFNGSRTDVALDDFRPLLRRGRDIQRHCGIDRRNGPSAEGTAP